MYAVRSLHTTRPILKIHVFSFCFSRSQIYALRSVYQSQAPTLEDQKRYLLLLLLLYICIYMYIRSFLVIILNTVSKQRSVALVTLCDSVTKLLFMLSHTVTSYFGQNTVVSLLLTLY